MSPASAALQTRIQAQLKYREKIKVQDLQPVHLHKTYYDREVLQARANALFYNKDTYAWLKNRPGLKIVPVTRFIDMPCDELAKIFCDSVLALLSDGAKAKKQVSIAPLKRPLGWRAPAYADLMPRL